MASSTSANPTASPAAAPAQARLTASWTPTTPMPGEPVQFTAKVDGLASRSVDSYGWDFGDDTTATGKDATHEYADTGNRTVTARALLSDGTIVRATRAITVGMKAATADNGTVEAESGTTLPGDEGCTTHQSTNPRPDAWYSLGKPATYYDDGCFHQYMVNEPDTATLDVLIVPPPGATALRDANLLRASVRMWESGLKAGARTHGMHWLADGLSITPMVLGEDVPAGPSAFAPDIVVVLGDAGPAGVMWAYAGVGTDAFSGFCKPVQSAHDGTLPSPDALRTLPGYDGHHGGGWGTVELGCETGGRVCVVAGAALYDLPDDFQAINFFDLMSHELGHCLGLGHVGDASDFGGKAYPPDDIMSYEQDDRDPGVALCVSNLNLKTFAYRYRPFLAGGDPLGYSADRDGYVTMAGGADPAPDSTVLNPLPESSWRIFRTDGTESPSASECPQPNLALIQLPP